MKPISVPVGLDRAFHRVAERRGLSTAVLRAGFSEFAAGLAAPSHRYLMTSFDRML